MDLTSAQDSIAEAGKALAAAGSDPDKIEAANQQLMNAVQQYKVVAKDVNKRKNIIIYSMAGSGLILGSILIWWQLHPILNASEKEN